jgi:hypothetical protein
MSDVMADPDEAILAEVRSVRETADRMANGEFPEEADHSRALAGLVRQLAEQLERHLDHREPAPARVEPAASASSGGARLPAAPVDESASAEEDRTPEDAPADPANDRAR